MNQRIERRTRMKHRHPSLRDFHFAENYAERSRWSFDRLPRPELTLEPYTHEDEVLDQLGQLPSKDQVRLLLQLLRRPELQELAEGVINDVSSAAKLGDNLATAKAINSWIATIEEPIASRRKLRHVLGARARGGKL